MENGLAIAETCLMNCTSDAQNYLQFKLVIRSIRLAGGERDHVLLDVRRGCGVIPSSSPCLATQNSLCLFPKVHLIPVETEVHAQKGAE